LAGVGGHTTGSPNQQADGLLREALDALGGGVVRLGDVRNLLQRARSLFITTSPIRADNIRRLALHYFQDLFTQDQLGTFFEVLPLEAARRKLRTVTARAEAQPTLPEMPWIVELREQATAATEARAEREAEAARAAVERARNDPLHVPYRCCVPGTPERAPYTLPVEEGCRATG
jgi:hypothetical protein